MEVSEEDQIARPDVSSVVQKKKRRTIAESSAKHAKVEASPNSNLKGKSTKSGLKSRSEGKSDGRNEDDEPGSKSKANLERALVNLLTTLKRYLANLILVVVHLNPSLSKNPHQRLPPSPKVKLLKVAASLMPMARVRQSQVPQR